MTNTQKDGGWDQFDGLVIETLEEHGPHALLDRVGRIIDGVAEWMNKEQENVLRVRLRILRNSVTAGGKTLATEKAQASLVWQIDDLAKCLRLEWNVPPLQGAGLEQYQEFQRTEYGGGVR